MYCSSMRQARKQAQENARFFKQAYCVFFDTAQNAHCEAYCEVYLSQQALSIYYPNGERWDADKPNVRKPA